MLIFIIFQHFWTMSIWNLGMKTKVKLAFIDAWMLIGKCLELIVNLQCINTKHHCTKKKDPTVAEEQSFVFSKELKNFINFHLIYSVLFSQFFCVCSFHPLSFHSFRYFVSHLSSACFCAGDAAMLCCLFFFLIALFLSRTQRCHRCVPICVL